MKFTHLLGLLFLTSNIALATETSSIEIFASNNTKEIDIKTAYKRLTSAPQQQLQKDIISVLQKNHFEEGTLYDILGTYQMASDNNQTGDNTEVFYTSPQQQFDHEKIISVAQQLASVLQQESVAVFIPNNTTQVGEIKMMFGDKLLSIADTIQLLQTRLPLTYNQAYSLHLSDEYAGYGKARVDSVEWLGSKVNLNTIQQAFPGTQISSRDGSALLVYSDGHTETL